MTRLRIAAIFLLAAWTSASAQPRFFVSDSDVRACSAPEYARIFEAIQSNSDPAAVKPAPAEQRLAPNSNGLVIVLYLVAVEVAFAVIVALACGLILVLIGLCLRFGDRPARALVPPFLRVRPAFKPVKSPLFAPRKISAEPYRT